MLNMLLCHRTNENLVTWKNLSVANKINYFIRLLSRLDDSRSTAENVREKRLWIA